MKHKSLSFLLAVLMSMVASVASAEDFEVGGIYYKITSSTDMTVAVTYRGSSPDSYTNKYTGRVTIPETVTYNGITNSVTSIGGYAFYGCSGLTSVEIPNSVTSIGNYAFNNCSGLTSVEIPNSVTCLGKEVFYKTNLKSVTMGTGLLCIGENAFSTPKKVIWLTNTPPEGYKYANGQINYVANNQYTSLRNKTVYPYLSSMFEVGGVKYVPVSPSERTCDAIDCLYDNTTEEVNVGSTVSYKGVAMNVKDIHPYALYMQTTIKSLQISNQGAVGSYAFYGCTGLQTVNIANLGNIDTSAFESSNINGTLTIENAGSIGNKAFASVGGNFTATIYTTSGGAFSDKVEDSGRIMDNAFNGCTGIRSVVMGDGVKSIHGNVFQGCKNMESATLGSAVASIGNYAFDGCSALKFIVIPDAVTTIGEYNQEIKGVTNVEIIPVSA